ncbi:replication initiation protein [Hydrogenophaga aromaticivorans]|uniref:replication initiation protein n=1 Tax=Hydrogenophaga aromaticivorans TaxID=2610898 RepID=UPI001B37824C|nr:replication initiation protein [Hydrogenophaga aromaticivorans]MBQ0916871.1 replication initiation protein [Hydrogenophaga aromaticivorans]
MQQLSVRLFPPQAPNGRAVLLKPNMALVMVPRVGRLTAIGRKVLDALLYETQQQVRQRTDGVQGLDARHLFEAPLKSILSHTKSQDSSTDPRTLVKQTLLEMRRLEVDWEAPDASSGVIWRSMSVLSEAGLELRQGNTWVTWAFPPSLMTVLADPKQYHYTQIDLEQSSRLQGYTAIALYQVCRRYKTSPTGVTCRCPPDWWVDALTNTPATVLPDGSVRRREWRKLKSESVLKAVQEINEHTDIEIELLEFREGRMVTQVQFAVRRKALPNIGDLPKLSDELVRLGTEVGIPLKDLSGLVKIGHSESNILPALVKLQARLGRPDLVEVQSRTAYLRSLLEEMDLFRAAPAENARAKDGEPSAVDHGYVETQPAPRWIDSRRDDIDREFRQLSRDEQQKFVDQVLSLNREAGWMTATLFRRLQTSEWRETKVLYLKVRDEYAKAVYGEDWDIEPQLF